MCLCDRPLMPSTFALGAPAPAIVDRAEVPGRATAGTTEATGSTSTLQFRVAFLSRP